MEKRKFWSAQEAAREDGQDEAVEKFLSSDRFALNMQELASSTFVLGFTKAMDEVSPLLSKDQWLTL